MNEDEADGAYRANESPEKPAPTPEEEDLVVLERTHDPLRADMVCEILDQNGIVVATPGRAFRGLFPGPHGGHVDIVIRVPRKRLRRAQRLIEVLGPDKSFYSEARRWRVAGFAGITFWPVGGAHLYAGAYASAVVLFGAQLLSLWAVFTDRVLLAPLLCVGVMLCDVFGSKEACARANAKLPVKNGWLSRGALLSVALVPLGFGILHFVAPPILASRDGRAVCDFAARCGGADIEAFDACIEDAARIHLEGGRVLPSGDCTDCFASEELSCDEIAWECGDGCAPGAYFF